MVVVYLPPSVWTGARMVLGCAGASVLCGWRTILESKSARMGGVTSKVIGRAVGCGRNGRRLREDTRADQIVPSGSGFNHDDALSEMENGNSPNIVRRVPKPPSRDLNPQDPGSSGGEGDHEGSNSYQGLSALKKLQQLQQMHGKDTDASSRTRVMPSLKRPVGGNKNHRLSHDTTSADARKQNGEGVETSTVSSQKQRLRSMKRRRSLPGIRKSLPSEEHLKLAFAKIFRDGLKHDRKHMKTERLRMVIASVNATRNRSPPSRSETQRMLCLMRGMPRREVKSEKEIDREQEDALAVSEPQFVQTLMGMVALGDRKAADGGQGEQPLNLRDEELKQCRKFRVFVKIVVRNYESRIAFLHRTFKVYSSLEGHLGFEELQMVLTYFAPDRLYEPTMEESCLFLGVIKNASGKHVLDSSSHEDVKLNEKEFLNWVLNGSYQPERDMQLYVDRSAMHRKIYYCLSGFVNQAEREERKRLENGEGLPIVSVSQRDVLRMMVDRPKKEEEFPYF
jgi:hypothetical protein